MKILLTGASGFVGQHFAAVADTVPLDHGAPVDLREADHVLEAVGRVQPQAVVHLAAQSFVPESFRDPGATFAVNFTGTFNLLRALKVTGFRGRMLYASSGDVYGLVPESELPVSEARPSAPRNPYAVSKVAAEALCHQWTVSEGIDVVVARAFNHVGPRQNERFVLSDAARQLALIRLGRQPAVVRLGDCTVTRDFTDVRDVVAAYLALIARAHTARVYNVCSGIERRIDETVLRMASLAGLEVTLDTDMSRVRPTEQRRMAGDNSRLRAETDWRPGFDWDRTLADMYDQWLADLSA